MVVQYHTLSPIPSIKRNSELLNHCYLCGRSRAELEENSTQDKSHPVLDREHVIPKVVFKPNATDKPVLLFACRACNQQKGLDDEFITNHIQIGAFNTGSEERLKRIRRSFERPQAAGLRADFDQRISVDDVYSRDGTYLGVAPTLRLDEQRFNTFFTNIAKGLWVRNTLRLKNWSEFDVSVGIEQTAIDDRMFHDPAIVGVIKNRQCAEWWEDHFLYFGAYPPAIHIDSDRASFWFMYLYTSFSAYVIFTHKEGSLRSPRSPQVS